MNYKAPDNSLHFLDDSAFEYLLPAGSVQITDAQAEAMRPVIPPPTYAQLRAAAYPPIADYLDGIVKGNQSQVDAYVAACLAVKALYPKA